HGLHRALSRPAATGKRLTSRRAGRSAGNRPDPRRPSQLPEITQEKPRRLSALSASSAAPSLL
ncbi:MAG: hypothetical protein KDK11_20605, partial [Maritimibacter sp.]|nr:hypothetical protein [Maritimibacter sp.]